MLELLTSAIKISRRHQSITSIQSNYSYKICSDVTEFNFFFVVQ